MQDNLASPTQQPVIMSFVQHYFIGALWKPYKIAVRSDIIKSCHPTYFDVLCIK
jgi:hypothetical protein